MATGSPWPFKSGWKEKLDTPGAVEMAYVKALFEPRAWYSLVPDQDHKVVTGRVWHARLRHDCGQSVRDDERLCDRGTKARWKPGDGLHADPPAADGEHD